MLGERPWLRTFSSVAAKARWSLADMTGWNSTPGTTPNALVAAALVSTTRRFVARTRTTASSEASSTAR